jgi:hypothetical protein
MPSDLDESVGYVRHGRVTSTGSAEVGLLLSRVGPESAVFVVPLRNRWSWLV